MENERDDWRPFEALEIDPEQWGEAKLIDCHLVYVADLVNMVRYVEDAPVNPCIRAVFDRLVSAPGLRLYLTKPHEFALEIDPGLTIKGQEDPGAVGVLKAVRGYWLDRQGLPFAAEALGVQGGQLAIRFEDSKQLFEKLWSRFVEMATPPDSGSAPVPAIDARPAKQDSAALLRLAPRFDQTAHDAEQCRLREQIEGHEPVKKAGHHWPKPGGLEAAQRELLRQYQVRRLLDGSTQDTAEEKLSELWELSKGTVHGYLVQARKLPAIDAPEAKSA